MRILLVAILAALTLAAFSTSAAAQDPGMPTDARVELREGAGGQVLVVVSWNPSVNPAADYQVWRRTPWDISFQIAEPYADVPASARLPDGTFEFVDPTPFAIPERPCYMVSATLGDPPQAHALPGCIPTLPGAMPGLAMTALPGPYPNSWYITGTGFAPGAYIELQELTCPSVPCPGRALSVPGGRIAATIDGRFSIFTALAAGRTEGTRRIVAHEPGWLPSQLAVAPGVDVPAAHTGAVSGYPASIRTAEPAVDRVLDVLVSNEPERFAALLQFRKLPALSDGQLVDALPKVTCGNGDGLAMAPEAGEPVATRLNALVGDFFGFKIYAVFRIAPAPGQWKAFEGATHAIVLVSAAPEPGYWPRSAILAANESGVVGVGQPCGAPPTYYLRDIASFILAPLTSPAPPATGTGNARRAGDSSDSIKASGLLLLELAAGLSLALVVGRRPGRHQRD
jgi:hypothetical protein